MCTRLTVQGTNLQRGSGLESMPSKIGVGMGMVFGETSLKERRPVGMVKFAKGPLRKHTFIRHQSTVVEGISNFAGP